LLLIAAVSGAVFRLGLIIGPIRQPYQDEEYALLGKAMKFADIYGKEIRVIGKNRETLTAKAAFLQ
jgi:hypothetical protein